MMLVDHCKTSGKQKMYSFAKQAVRWIELDRQLSLLLLSMIAFRLQSA